MGKVCPCCGQPLPEMRHGVRLPPMKARILDLIKARPGINSADLCSLLYDRVDASTICTLRNHIYQIRDALRGSDIIVTGHKHWGYHILKKRRSHAAQTDQHRAGR